MKKLIAVVLATLVPSIALAQAPTCEEQVTLLQGYVAELANQRSALESRLIMAQAEAKKRQEMPVGKEVKPSSKEDK